MTKILIIEDEPDIRETLAYNFTNEGFKVKSESSGKGALTLSKSFEPDIIILLQPTSPFRKLEDIKNAVQKFSMKIDMVVSVKEGKANPYFNLYEENDNGFLKKSKKSTFDRYQDCPVVWEFNGSIYVINTAMLKRKGFSNFDKIIKYKIDNPIYSLDIDTEYDWLIANTIIEQKI